MFGVSNLITFLHAATPKPTGTFQSYSRLQLDDLYFVTLFSSLIVMVDTIGAYSIFQGTRFNMAVLLMVWTATKFVDRPGVTCSSSSQLRPFVMQSCTVSVLSEKSSAQAVQSDKEIFVLKPQLLEDPFSRRMPSWSSLCRQANEYLHRQRQTPLPSYVSESPVFLSYTLRACHSAVIVLLAILVAVASPHDCPTFKNACFSLFYSSQVDLRGS